MATGITGLIKVDVSKKNNQTYSKTLLLATNRILDSYLSSTGVAEFWYEINPADLKSEAVLFTATTYTVRNLDWAINRADTTQNRFHVHVMRERRSGRQEVTRDKMVKMYADQILYAYDNSDGLTCTMFVKRGSEVVRWQLSHILNDIIRAASKSASLSRSPMS